MYTSYHQRFISKLLHVNCGDVTKTKCHSFILKQGLCCVVVVEFACLSNLMTSDAGLLKSTSEYSDVTSAASGVGGCRSASKY